MSILGLLIVVSLALGALAWLFFVWTVRSGQYEDPEGPKYRMLEDEEGASPAPDGRAAPPHARSSAAAGDAAARPETAHAQPAPSPAPPEPAAPRDPAAALRAAAAPAPGGAPKKPPAPQHDVPASRRNGVHRP